MRQVLQQAGLAAEEMGAARDVEEETVSAALRIVDGNRRRIALRPHGKTRERGGICGRIGIAHLQIENLGPRR